MAMSLFLRPDCMDVCIHVCMPATICYLGAGLSDVDQLLSVDGIENGWGKQSEFFYSNIGRWEVLLG